MKKVSLILGMVFVLGLFLGTSPASADGRINWTGHGSENLPCTSGGHWVLAPSFNITAATLVVNGSSYTMTQNGSGSWSADSVGALTSSLTAYVDFTGAGDSKNHLQLSHCVDTTPPPTTPPPTTPPPTTPPPVEDKTSFCHASTPDGQGAGTFQYEFLTTSVSGAYHGHYLQHENDIMPPFVYDGSTYSLNWDVEGQAIYNNGCAVPTTPPTTPPPSPSPDKCEGHGADRPKCNPETTKTPPPPLAYTGSNGIQTAAFGGIALLMLLTGLGLLRYGMKLRA
jgi:hypothetical protein